MSRRRQPPGWTWAKRRLGIAVVLFGVAASGGCKNRNRTGDLYPPDDAPPWEQRLAVAFDDDYTPESLRLQGRAPHDVLDQRLFAHRLGDAAIVALVRIEQVWGRGRYQGRKNQYLDIHIDEVVLGELPKGTRDEQLLEVTGEDELPGDLQGASMVLFVRWAPGDHPPFHHHLMPATDDIVAYIRALVRHATEEGMLGGGGRKRKRKHRGNADEPAEGAQDDAP